MVLRGLFLFLSLLVIFCTTKDGIEVITSPGNIWVSSTMADSARIFLDYRDTGQYTPALLQDIPVGPHVIHLFRGTYRPSPDSVLVEVKEGRTDSLQFALTPTLHGKLSVDSEPDSARVFINRLEFGMTPLQIDGLPEGEYYLQITKGNFSPLYDTLLIAANDDIRLFYPLQVDLRRMVLLEHFSNTSCPPCPQSDAIIDNLGNLYGADKLVIVGYHANFPSPTDPMYLSAKAANDSRLNFWRPASIPRAYVDGLNVNDPLSETCYRTLIDTRLQEETHATIAFQQVNRGTTAISGSLQLRALQDIPAGYRLYIALIEDEIDYSSPPGTNGQTHFEAVLRAFCPDGGGLEITLSLGERFQTDFLFSLAGDWGSDLTVLAFLQHSTTRTVLQSAWTRYPPF